MADLSTSFFEPALKQYYDKAQVENLVYADRPLFAMLKKKTDFVGEVQKLPLIYGNPQGSSHTFSKAVANKTNSKLKAFLISMASDYAIATISNEVLEASSNDRGAFLSVLTKEIDGAMDTLARRISIQLFRSGSGQIGKIAAAQSAGATILSLANPDDIVNFEVGMTLVGDSADGGGTVGTTISYVVMVDRDSGTFSASASQGGAAATATTNDLTANQFIFVEGDYDLALKGLQAWLPTTVALSDSFLGVNRSSDKTRLAGVYIDCSGLTMEEALIKGSVRASREGGKPDYCFINHTDYARLQEELGSKILYMDVKAGQEAVFMFRGIQLNGAGGRITVIADRDCPSGEAFVLTTSTWALLSRGEPVRLFQADGQRVLREANDDAVTARVISYAQLTCNAPGFNCRIKLR